MILNGYNTLVGTYIKLPESAYSTLKGLSTTNRLKVINKEQNIFAVDFENGESLPLFIFPITLKNYSGENFTVIDQRSYFNKSGKLTNQPEYSTMEIAALLQQKSANGDSTVIRASRPYTVKAFAKSISENIIRRIGFGLDNQAKRMEIEIILAHYYVCLTTNIGDDLSFVSSNVIRNSLGYPQSYVMPIVETLGIINNLKELYTTLKEYPSLFVLSKMDLKGFIEIINQTWIVLSRYKEIISASVEMPHLYTAICYSSVVEKVYQNSLIGRVLDKRNNPNIATFVNTVKSGLI